MNIVLNSTERTVLLNALIAHHVALADSMVGDERDNWAYDEMQRLSELQCRLEALTCG